MSEGVEWALHCCGVLGAIPPPYTLSAARLAEYHGIPPAYLAKHLQALSRAGIVESVPGPKGGYRMARAPGEVTVLDVVLAVEGDTPAFECTEIRRQGPCGVDDPTAYPTPCGIKVAMLQAEKAWRDSLTQHTVADLVHHAVQEAPQQQIADSMVWIRESARDPSAAGNERRTR